MTPGTDDRDPPLLNRLQRVVSMRALLFGLVGAAIAASPWVFAGLGAGHVPLLAGVVAWRSLLTAVLWVFSAILAAAAAFRSVRRAVIGVLIPAAILALVGTAMLLAPGMPAHRTARAGQQFTVLSWNINGSLVDAKTVERETMAHRPDVLALPAVDDEEFMQLARALASVGYAGVRADGSEAAIFSTSGYRAAPMSEYGPGAAREAVADGTSVQLPRLVAVHVSIPLLPRGNAAWNREVRWLGSLCHSRTPTVILGDFNSTTDNFAGTGLTACADAATAFGAQYRGTWPAQLTPALGSTLDHVLVAGRGVSVTSYSVLRDEDRSGSRHRPVLATVTIAQSP